MDELEALQRKLQVLDNTDPLASQVKKPWLDRYVIAGIAVMIASIFMFSFSVFIIGAFILSKLYLMPSLKGLLQQRQAHLLKADDIWRTIKQTILLDMEEVSGYDAKPTFPMAAYTRNLIFPRAHTNRHYAKDLISGTYNSVPYHLIDLDTRYAKEKKGSLPEVSLVFRGLFLSVDFNKRFSSFTVITTDKNEKTFGAVGRAVQRFSVATTPLPLVELETPEFEECFQVRSNDAIEARYILSVHFMEQLLALKAKMNTEIQLCFIDGKMMVSIPTMTPFLDNRRDITSPSLQKKTIEDDIKDILHVIDHLQLQQQLWRNASGAN